MKINRWLFFGFPLLAGAFAAIFSPDNALDFKFFEIIYSTASFVFPAVRKMKGDYELGQVAKFYYSSIWLLSPLIFCGSYIDLQRQRDKIIANCRGKGLFFILFFCVFSLACALLLVNFTFESRDVNDVRIYMSFHSRWGMALVGGVVPASASALIAMVVFGITNIRCVFD